MANALVSMSRSRKLYLSILLLTGGGFGVDKVFLGGVVSGPSNSAAAEVIAMPSGEKIHPETIERELNTSPDVANSVVFLGRGPHLSCIVSLTNARDLDAMARVRKLVSGLAAKQSAARFMNVVFASEAFSRENGMLRPNMKIDRKKIIATYSANSDSLKAHG